MTTAAHGSALVRAAALVQPHLWDYVTRFHDGAPGAGRAGRCWPGSARRARPVRGRPPQARRAVLDPGTTGRSWSAGAVRSAASWPWSACETDWYADAVTGHQSMVFDVLAPHAHRARLRPRRSLPLNERFLLDLHGVLQGYRDLEIAQSRVLVRVSEVVSAARTVADLARGVLEALSLLDGTVSVFIGRPDDADDFLFEAGAGDGVEELISWLQAPDAPRCVGLGHHPRGPGPAGRAWRSGEIVRSDSYLTDPSTASVAEVGRAVWLALLRRRPARRRRRGAAVACCALRGLARLLRLRDPRRACSSRSSPSSSAPSTSC